MFSSSSDSDKHSAFDNSDYDSIPSVYSPEEIENASICSSTEFDSGNGESRTASGQTQTVEPYSSEPIADEEWLNEYRERQKDKERRLDGLKDRLSGREALQTWCSCGKCSTAFLQNVNECYCCRDMEKCLEALSDNWVLQEMQTVPQCITLHPAFKTVCLDRWSLRLSAGKYRRIDKKSYRQTSSEEAFMRSVSYREFIHLVYDHVGRNRIALPACAYHAIRTKFQPKDTTECFVGFQEEEEEEMSE